MDTPLDVTIASYDATAVQYAEKTLAIDTGKLIGEFNGLLAGPSRILDVGCGPGRDAKRFLDLGHRVVGIDLSENLLGIAREQAPAAEFHNMDVLDLDYADGYFEGVWAMSVLMHLPKADLVRAFNECARVLRPGGVCYASLKRGLGEGLELDKRYGVEKYFAYYTDEEIRELLTGVRMETIRCGDAETLALDYQTHPWMDIFLRKR